MEAKEFGNFISQIRKEKGLTQAELAARINVTDKAVSRWERGLGFPDINTLDPLAEALNISIMELMRSCRREAADEAAVITKEDVSEVLNLAANMTNYHKKRQTAVLIGIFIFTVLVTFLFVDHVNAGSLFLLAVCGVVGLGSTYLLIKEWEDEKCRYLYLRLVWISFGTIFVGCLCITPNFILKSHMRIVNTSVNWFFILVDFIIVYQAILNAKKGKLKWRWAIFTIIIIAVMLFWGLYSYSV